ncbi:MAG: alkaline phosphatase family protein [Candidatus Izemoplasmatales bacterium]
MKKYVVPDYKNSVLNVTGSILKHYGVKTEVSSLPLLDAELAKGYRNVVLFLVDAMGEFAIKKFLSKKAVLNRDKRASITSVFPSTTVSATTAVISGKSPIESGWIGWSQYFHEEAKTIILFRNTDYYNDSTIINHPVAETELKYQTIYSQIEAMNPDVKTHELFPAFRTPEHDTVQKLCATIIKTTQSLGKNFIYAYWDKLDTLMHEYGPASQAVKLMVREINNAYQHMIEVLTDDTIVIVIADHGQVAVKPLPLWNYPNLEATFLHKPSVESRMTAFFIKPEQRENFVSQFKKHFDKKYLLYPSDEVVKMGWFGFGTPHPRFREFIGDYLAIAISHYYFQLFEYPTVMKGQHAGILPDEMTVPLIIHSSR